MLYNNLKIALRTLRKNKIYTAINVLGLTVGIAAALLIFRLVNYELSFNKNFKGYDRIVRVIAKVKTPEQGEQKNVCIPIPAMEEIINSVSQFEAIGRIHETWSSITVPNPNGGPPLKKFSTEDPMTAFFADPGLLKVFDYQWLAGDPNTALNEPGTIILTKTWAEKCFGYWEAAIGETVLVDHLIPVQVTGIIEDLPTNCDFTFPYLISYETVKKHADLFFYLGGWGSCSSNNQIYALLQSKDQWATATKALAKVGEKEYTDKTTGVRKKTHIMQPLSELHYDEDLGHSGSHQTSKNRLRILGFIGILILIIACFNFINLATAQATIRAKEVGVRKTLGGRPGQLIGQFMSETGIIVLISVLLGANLASLTAPLLKYVSDVPDSLPFLGSPIILVFLAILAIVITLLAGLYPAFTLASYQPVEALKSKITNKTFGGLSLSKSLVVLQFVIAQALIIGAIITINQLDYIRSQDLGFNKDLVYTFVIGTDSTTQAKQNGLKQRLLQIPTIETVSFSSDQPLSGNTWQSNFRYGSRPEDERYSISLKFCDIDYQKTYGLQLLAGKWLSLSDTMRQAVVNQTLLKKLGIRNPQEVVGQNISLGRRSLPIVGVTKDFHTHSLHQDHEPLLITSRKAYYWEVGVKIRRDDISASIASIKNVFDQVLPEQVFVGNFLDEDIAQFYQSDDRLSATCKGFGLLAILISCLGLFGLATHAAAQRVKEIGVRRVLGASVSNIIGLLSKDFLALVMVALLIASPIAWYFMDRWLDNFVFRIDIQWWVFVLAGVMAVVIAFLTVSYQSVRAALASPVKSLKSE